ncbi:MAG TPA: hypothetical protein VNL96_03815 [Gemmatimonadaceae bacterium]|nr:hypothetical protein [Gemmatimonadaceae bacterium]
MARALVMRSIQLDERAVGSELARWRTARASLEASGCHLWIFRSASDQQRFVEFVEGRDPSSLCAARQRAGLEGGNVELFIEVQL